MKLSQTYFLSTTRKRHTRRGSALVEFAFVAPILIFLSLCMVQFGIILNTKITLSNVARQVSRYAAVNGTKVGADAMIKSYAVTTAAGLGLAITDANVTVGPPAENPTATPTTRVRYITDLPVSITYDMQGKLFLPTRFFDVQFIATTATSTTTVVVE